MSRQQSTNPSTTGTPETAEDENVLHELNGGELLLNPRNEKTYRVHRVRKPKRDTGYEEKLFRLENIVVGHKEWTQEELAESGLKEI